MVLWELHFDAEEAGEFVRGSTVLRMTIWDGDPRLRIYYTIQDDSGPDGSDDICWLAWLEIDPEWAAEHRPRVHLGT